MLWILRAALLFSSFTNITKGSLMQHDWVLGPSFWLATDSSCCGLTLQFFLRTASIFLGSAESKRSLNKVSTQRSTEGLRKEQCSVPHRDSAMRMMEEWLYSWKALCGQNRRSSRVRVVLESGHAEDKGLGKKECPHRQWAVGDTNPSLPVSNTSENDPAPALLG